MRSLKTQMRLGKWAVDEAQRRLAELGRQQDTLNAARAALDAEVTRERSRRDQPMATLTYTAFAGRISGRRADLDRRLADIARDVAEATTALAEAFTGLKTVELLDEAARTRAEAEAARLDQGRQNEIALTIFRRAAEEDAADFIR